MTTATNTLLTLTDLVNRIPVLTNITFISIINQALTGLI